MPTGIYIRTKRFRHSEETSFLTRLHLLAKKMFSGDFSMLSYSPLYSEANGVSIINIDGEIGKKLSHIDKENGKVDVDDITKALKIAASAPTECVLLCINSPGGTSTGIEECGNVITKLTETKPVITFTDTIAASAAYWLSACSNGIYMTPSAEVGSIGVYAKVVDYSENLKMQGINVQVFSAGSMKTMGHGDKPLTEEEEKHIQKDIDEQWVKFKTLVTTNRGDVKEEYMQGQLLEGQKAVEANLADEVVSDYETLISQISTK